MTSGRWKQSPEAFAEEAFCVLIRGDKAQRTLPKATLISYLRAQDVLTPFLKLCIEHDDSHRLDLFRKGLLLVVQSIGTTRVAAAAKIHRVTLYRMLSKEGNPSLENLLRIVAAVGLRLWVVDEDFFARRQRVVRPKDVVPQELVKVSRGRRIRTRSRYERDPEDKW